MDLVLLCMDFRYYQHEGILTNTQYKQGKSMIWVRCPLCKDRDIYRYSINFTVRHGFTNPSNHFPQCVGGDKNIATMVKWRLAAKHAKKEEEEGSREEECSRAITNNWVLKIQQSLPIYDFFPSKIILLIHMWAQKIVLMNMPIYDIEHKVELELVLFPKVKSVKTVLNTAYCLVKIVKKSISHMIKNAPAGQIIFNGYTVGG
jgi:hypothetical protein